MASYITLRHCTPARNVPKILKEGLRPEKSKTARSEVWLCQPKSRTAWAVIHVAHRHHTNFDRLTILEVRVRRDRLQRRRAGLYSCRQLIPPSQIVACESVNELF